MKKHVCILYEIYVQANYLYIIKAIFIWHVFIYIPNLLYILAIIFLWSKNNTDITVQSLIIYCNQCMCCQIVYFMYLWCLYVCIHMCFLFWFLFVSFWCFPVKFIVNCFSCCIYSLICSRLVYNSFLYHDSFKIRFYVSQLSIIIEFSLSISDYLMHCFILSYNIYFLCIWITVQYVLSIFM